MYQAKPWGGCLSPERFVNQKTSVDLNQITIVCIKSEETMKSEEVFLASHPKFLWVLGNQNSQLATVIDKTLQQVNWNNMYQIHKTCMALYHFETKMF